MKRQSLILLVVLLVFCLNYSLFSQIKKNGTAFKKLVFEVSGGIALIHKHESFYNRVTGTEALIAQYARYYKRSLSTTGDLHKLKMLIPLNLSLNYNFNKRWCLKIGFEYSSGKTFTEKQHSISWQSTEESYFYEYDYRISSLMPFVGAEARFFSFGVYANVGYNITDFSFTQSLRYEEGGVVQLEEDEAFDTNRKAIAIILGGKYRIRLGRKVNLLLKLEYLYLNLNSFKGEKKSSSGTAQGTIYTHEINPYDIDWVGYWDLYESKPDDPALRDVNKLGLDLSCLRLMIGFSF